jgi:hypothetical protein
MSWTCRHNGYPQGGSAFPQPILVFFHNAVAAGNLTAHGEQRHLSDLEALCPFPQGLEPKITPICHDLKNVDHQTKIMGRKL